MHKNGNEVQKRDHTQYHYIDIWINGTLLLEVIRWPMSFQSFKDSNRTSVTRATVE